ncbi:MAG: putative membrane protein [Planctomycetota bacterium]|jgi:uncharacterized membrane protein
MTTNSAILWVFDSRMEAEASIKELDSHHVDTMKLSIACKGKCNQEHVMGFYNVGERMREWGRFGAFWGLLLGAAMFVIPGVDHLTVFGPIVGSIVGALAGAVMVGGMCALGAALHGLGSAVQYEAAIYATKFVLVVNGSAAEVAKVKRILISPRAAPDAPSEVSELPIASVLVMPGTSKGLN